MENHLEDIKKYDPKPNEAAVKKIASDLRLVMNNSDARYVATGDKAEIDRIIKNFAEKKLGVDQTKSMKAVESVSHKMAGTRHKSRVTFYYLLAKELGKLDAV